jgi:hypothetical protein
MYKLYINIGVLVASLLVISIYCLHVKMLYPKWVIELFTEPIGLYFTYMFVYLVSFYNELIALLLLICVVLVHLDIINIVKK